MIFIPSGLPDNLRPVNPPTGTLTPTSPGREQSTTVQYVAQKLIWWQQPAETLKNPPRLVVQVMTLGTWEDVKTAQAEFGQTMFRSVLESPPAGVFDPASWVYWHNVFGIHPIPPLPTRKYD